MAKKNLVDQAALATKLRKQAAKKRREARELLLQANAAVGSAPGPAGTLVYWHVDDVRDVLEKLRSLGAKEHQAPTDRSEGFVTASVVNPFGNILGIMSNLH